jgi:ribosomal-protein-alanine acetyltransferase
VDADSSPEIHIRKAGPSDLAGILRIEQDCFTWDCFNRRQFRYLMTRAKAAFWVAEQKGIICAYTIQLLPEGSRGSRLYSLAVDPAFQGKGIGRALIHHAAMHAGMLKYATLYLEVRTDNGIAIESYKKAGFESFGIRKGYYEDGCDAALYRKSLSQLQA